MSTHRDLIFRVFYRFESSVWAVYTSDSESGDVLNQHGPNYKDKVRAINVLDAILRRLYSEGYQEIDSDCSIMWYECRLKHTDPWHGISKVWEKLQ